ITSTGNKIGRIFKPLTDECENIIKNNLPENWIINQNKSFNLKFFPLTNEYYHGEISIVNLENQFRIESAFNLEKLSNKKNNFWIYFGSHFSNDSNINQYYFSILKEEVNVKNEGIINPYSFYKDISNQTNDFYFEITH